MPGKPSYLTSTFSIMSLIAVCGFVGLCLWTKNVEAMKELTLLMLGGYSVKKGMEFRNGNGTKHEEPPVVP